MELIWRGNMHNNLILAEVEGKAPAVPKDQMYMREGAACWLRSVQIPNALKGVVEADDQVADHPDAEGRNERNKGGTAFLPGRGGKSTPEKPKSGGGHDDEEEELNIRWDGFRALHQRYSLLDGI